MEDGEEDNEENDDDDDENDDDEEDDVDNDEEVEEEPVHEYSNSAKSSRFEEDLDEFLSSYSTVDNSSHKNNNKAHKRQKKESPLDPMDPAAYSDIPRGSWSQGLETKEKSGVDDSASGPLFQMRPYPSPGQILKMNSEGNKK